VEAVILELASNMQGELIWVFRGKIICRLKIYSFLFVMNFTKTTKS